MELSKKMNAELRKNSEDYKMKKESCPFKEKVNVFLDGELQSSEQVAMKKHASNCLICQQEIRELSNINNSLANWEDEAVPMDIYSRILAEADKISPIISQNKLPRKYMKLWRSVSNLSIAASILLAFFMGILLSNNSFGNDKLNDSQDSSYEVAFESYSMLSYLGED